MKLILGVFFLTSVLSACGDPAVEPSTDAGSVADVADLAPVQPDADDPEPDMTPPTGGGLALGAACDADEACRDGVCRDWPDGYCTTADCTNCPERCVDGGCAAACGFGCRPGYLCSPVEGGDDVCVPSATGKQHGEPCTSDLECAGGSCLDWQGGYCTKVGCTDDQDSCGHAGSNAVCEQTHDQTLSCLQRCESPTDCRPGYVCDDDISSAAFCRPPEPPVAPPTEFPTTCAANQNGLVQLPFDISPNARSAQIVGFVPDNFTLRPRGIETPAGDRMLISRSNGFDVRDLSFDNQVKPVPVGPRYWERDMLQPGRWELEIETSALEACAYVAEAPVGGRLLNLRVYLVGLAGLDAASAPNDPTMTTVIDTVRSTFAAVDIEFEEIEFVDARTDVATIYQYIRSYSNLGKLFATSRARAPSDRMHLNVFFIRGFLYDGLLGVSGGIPGPAGLHGSSGSGVAVAWEAQQDEPTMLGETVAHEIGHFLGLFHTTESNGSTSDLNYDTPACIGQECAGRSNLMYPFAVADGIEITAEQRWILKTHPLLKPDPACVDCDPLADCSGGSCTCVGDLVGDGSMCQDVDGCAQTCDVAAMCVDQLGGSVCSCPDDLVGDGTTCVDECGLNLAGCDPAATCTNMPGGAVCECPAGYVGDGFVCADIDECAMGMICPDDSTCVNSPGTAECVCDPGFEVSGSSCDNIDECLNPLTCPADSTCFDTDGSHHCDCAAGSTGAASACSPWSRPPATIAVGGAASCGLRADGSVQCWGETTFIGETHPGPFSTIAIANQIACGLRVSDNMMECWGLPVRFGALQGYDFLTLDCEYEECCGIRPNGGLRCFGAQFASEPGPFIDADVADNRWVAIRPDGTSDARNIFYFDEALNEVGTGADYACALSTSGELVCDTRYPLPELTPPTGTYTTLDGAFEQWCAISTAGSIVCWSAPGATAIGTPPAGVFEEVVVSWAHACARKSTGEVECWGSDTLGQSTVPANFP